jgi:hypothetical protein
VESAVDLPGVGGGAGGVVRGLLGERVAAVGAVVPATVDEEWCLACLDASLGRREGGSRCNLTMRSNKR